MQSATTGRVSPRRSPDHEYAGWPPGVPYIVGNEGCERFSFYGMRSILYVYMAQLYAHQAAYTERPEDFATGHYHVFGAAVYALPMVGAIVADRWLGKYRTILYLSIVYCLGHAVLSLTEETLWGLWAGLALIAVGSGGIKPCVSAHVGDQFGKKNWFRLRTIYQAFYFIINFGSAAATLMIPWIRDTWGVSIAFAVPGVLMLGATVFFWAGRNVFVHVPPNPGGWLGFLDTLSGTALFMTIGHLFFTAGLSWPVQLMSSAVSLVMGIALFIWRQSLRPDDGFLAVVLWSVYDRLRGVGTSPGFFGPARDRFGEDAVTGPVAVLRIMSVFFLVSVFWALFDQHASSWIRQAQMMDLVIWEGQSIRPAQLPAMNPFLVMLLIPFANHVLYRGAERLGFRATPLRRMTAGMLLAGFSFVVVALVQQRIDVTGPGHVSVYWQFPPYLIITLAEVFVSITGLEFAYSQAPPRMKSTVMGFWLLTVALGNVLVSVLAVFAKLSLSQFFWVFAALMFVAGAIFGVRAYFYRERDFVQN